MKQKSWVIFENVQQMVQDICVAFYETFYANLCKMVGNLHKIIRNIVIKFRHVYMYVLQRFCKIKGKLPDHLEIANFCSHTEKIFHK